MLRALKARQRREGGTLGSLASELLATALRPTPGERRAADLHWPSAELELRIDIEDKDALWRALDER